MTAQFPEQLLYNGETLAMCDEPLDVYFMLGGKNPHFEANCSACWRGYVGTWKIEADRLFLVEVSGVLQDRTTGSLESIFPGYPEQVFAHWYSGTLRCQRGSMVEHVNAGYAIQCAHAGYESRYEADFFIHVRKGIVVRHNLQCNADTFDASKAESNCQVGAFTTFSFRTPDDAERQ